MTQKNAWQIALSQLITDPANLLAALELDASLLPEACKAASLFPLKVSQSYLSRIQKGNPNDPLLRQILPLGDELVNEEGFSQDPLMESQFNPVPGLLHKYTGRVLVMLTSACAIHCRYCFRRDFPYQQNNPSKSGWDKIFNYISSDPSITEVILSGGDPLVVNDSLLKAFSDELVKIPHVKRLRIHSRLPIVLPERLTPEFIEWLSTLTLDSVMVIHANHAQEIDDHVRQGLLALRKAGVTVLNQSVLLRGVNDNAQTLAQLSEQLFTAGVLPYYLHVLDKAQGTAHFDIPLVEAQMIHSELLKILPGYLVPKLVWEKPHEGSKTHVAMPDIHI